MDVGILGWHDGTAGQIESWYTDGEKYNIRLFISHDDKPLNVSKINRPVETFSYPASGTFKNKPLMIEEEWWVPLKALEISAVILAIDDRFQRVEQLQNARKNGIQVLNAIHSSVSIGEDAKLGEGICLYPGVSIGYKAEIDDAVVINTGSRIDHHSRVKTGSTIDPGCTLAGNVEVGSYSQIHTGSTVVNKIKLAENTELGAGSLLLTDTQPKSLYYGIPASFVRET